MTGNPKNTMFKSNEILQICLSPAWGGLEMVALEMADALSSEGVVNCVAPDSTLEKRLIDKNHLTVRMPGSKKSYIRRSLALRRILKEGDYKVVLLHFLHDLWYLRLALLGLPKPKIIGFSHTFIGIRKKDRFHRWIYSLLDSLICLTDLQRKNLLEYLPVTEKQLKVIPNAVNTQRFNPNKKSEQIRQAWETPDRPILIGLVGRLDSGKGQDALIEAAKFLYDEGVHNFRVVLVGEDTLNARGTELILREMVARWKLEDVVIFAGFRSDVPEVMASFDICVMASVAETFGRVIIEGMASGVPVVATGLGGVRDIVDHGVNGLVISKKDSRELADALRILIQNKDLRTQLAEAGLQKARTVYAEEVVMAQIKSLF